MHRKMQERKPRRGCAVGRLKFSFLSCLRQGEAQGLLGPKVELKLALSVRGFLRGITRRDDLVPMIRLLGIFHGLGARAICSRGRRSFDGSPTKRRKAKHRDCQEHDPARREEGAVIVASEVIDFADEGGPKKRTDCNPPYRHGPNIYYERVCKLTYALLPYEFQCVRMRLWFNFRKVYTSKPQQRQPRSGMPASP